MYWKPFLDLIGDLMSCKRTVLIPTYMHLPCQWDSAFKQATLAALPSNVDTRLTTPQLPGNIEVHLLPSVVFERERPSPK